MVIIRRPKLDSSLDRIMKLVIKKNLLTSEAGVCGFSRPGEGSFFLLKTREAVLPHRALF
jgi:hypothetical protein